MAEVDPDDPRYRYKYKTFLKGRDRHVFDRKPRKIKYIVGNKFILDGDPFDINYMYDARQLLPVEETSRFITRDYDNAKKFGRLNDDTKYAKKEKPQHIDSGDEIFDMGII